MAATAIDQRGDPAPAVHAVEFERNHDDSDLVPLFPLSHVQGLLHRRDATASARRVSCLGRYSRFVELTPTALVPLLAYLRTCLGACTGVSFLDATALAVCDNHRIAQHHVFRGVAQRGKTSTGWFFGFKLHLLVNDRGELLNFALSPGNADVRRRSRRGKALFGKIFADKGYVSQPLFRQLLDMFGLQLITKLKSNMKNRLLPLADKLLLRKRAIIETVLDPILFRISRKYRV